MKRLSIKLRVTLWYAVLLVVIVSLVLGFMLSVSGSVVASDAKNRLTRVADDNADEVEYDDGAIDIDDDFAPYKNGVYSLVYTHDGVQAGGQAPPGFSSMEPLLEGQPRSVRSEGGQYYLYDVRIASKKHSDLWVRGIVSVDESTDITNSIIRTAFIALPVLVLLAVLGGYWVAKRSFQPIERIRSAADEISDGRDLTRRLELGEGEGKDEIHLLAQTFNRMFSRLEESFQAEKQFTSDASHELRTPASVILAQCEYALEHAETVEEYRDSLEVVRRQAVKVSRLISQLLSFTRAERGMESLSLEETDISELISILCEELSTVSDKGITLSARIEPDIRGQVDRAMMTRMASNLIGNAYRYGKENGKVEVSLSQSAEGIILSVEDDGIGIERKDQPNIWRRFYQANPSRTAEDCGSMGLGLAMVKQIAELHGGKATVASEPGHGSVFTVTLPNK